MSETEKEKKVQKKENKSFNKFEQKLNLIEFNDSMFLLIFFDLNGENDLLR